MDSRADVQCADSGRADTHVQKCRDLIKHAMSLNVMVEEIVAVEKIVLRDELVRELERGTDFDALTLQQARQLVVRVDACDLPQDHRFMQQIKALDKAGTAWESRAKHILEKSQRTLKELETYAPPKPRGMPIDHELLQHLLELSAHIVSIESAERLNMRRVLRTFRRRTPEQLVSMRGTRHIFKNARCYANWVCVAICAYFGMPSAMKCGYVRHSAHIQECSVL